MTHSFKEGLQQIAFSGPGTCRMALSLVLQGRSESIICAPPH